MGSILDKIAGNYNRNPGKARLSSTAEELVKKAFSDIKEGFFLIIMYIFLALELMIPEFG